MSHVVVCRNSTQLIRRRGNLGRMASRRPSGRLVAYTSGGASQTMTYNGADERVRVVTTPASGPVDTRVYVYDLDHRIIGEYGPGGNGDVRAEYIWTLPEVGASGLTGGDDGAGGYMPLAVVVGSGASAALRWVHGDHMGVPLVTTDATGAVVTPTGYGYALSGFPGQFANAVLLPGAAHYYNRYRDYDPTTGRYIQADPIGLEGDANPYAYALGNPLKYVDPTGEIAWIIPIAAGAVGGLLLDYGIEQFKKHHCRCRSSGSYGSAFGPAGNAALGAAIGATARGVRKPRTGIAGGGKSGGWTSAMSTANHALWRRGWYGIETRHVIKRALRVTPYLGGAIAATQIYDAVTCQ